MAEIPNTSNSPTAEYLLKLQLIVSNSEFKDLAEARKYETVESIEAADEYIHAMKRTDSFVPYTHDPKEIYEILSGMGYTDQKIMQLIKNQEMMPQTCKNELLNRDRERIIATYKEQNKYYLMLTGNPFPGNDTIPPDPIITIPEGFYKMYEGNQDILRDQPIHELSDKYKELFINSKYYKETIDKYPDVRYIRYIGSNSIPIVVSRTAQDGDIMKINVDKLSTYHQKFGNVVVTPDIVHKFVNVYRETRDYVYNTLRGDFSSIYANYDSFIRFLTIYLSIGNTLNEFMKNASTYIHMNNITANNLFMLYGLPSVIMEGSSMINFLKKFRLILMDKGTNIVYRVKDLIGYKYTDIYTLVMVKQQKFENGIPLYKYNDDGTKTPIQEIVFRRLGTTDDNTSYFKYKESNVSYTVEEVTSGDPRWWNTKEVEDMIQNMNYTLSNSKYIQLSTHLSITDVWWQCVILLRGILDNVEEVKNQLINVNYNINGDSSMSVFDAVLTLVMLMNHHQRDFNGNSFRGNLYIPNGIYNGKAACLDELFNGLHLAQVYEPLTFYSKGDVVGITLDQVYTVVDDYISSQSGIETDIANGKLTPYDGTWDEGAPKELQLGLPYKVASFNFNIRETDPDYYSSISNDEYLEPNKLLKMLDGIFNRHDNNIGMAIMSDVHNVYKYLEKKLVNARTIHQFRQVTDAYNKLFLVDPVRDWDYGTSDNIDELLMNEYGISELELTSLKSFFDIDPLHPELVIRYHNKDYPIHIYSVLNMAVYSLPINREYPFRDDGFVDLFCEEIMNFTSAKLEASNIARVIKKNYQSIIRSKVEYDSTNTEYGPKTFDALLRVSNVDLYMYLKNLMNSGKEQDLVTLMRAIILSLEDYVNTSLQGLSFAALGEEDYFRILREVITYFKSYMVEFTKDEFTYLFDGLFDNGGNSNMLKLYDEIVAGEFTGVPHDSFSLFDNSHADVVAAMNNDTTKMRLYDEAVFRVETTYGNLVNTGYPIYYDDNKQITTTPFDGLTNDTMVNATFINDSSSSSAYKIILNKNNVITKKKYYGNVIPQ